MGMAIDPSNEYEMVNILQEISGADAIIVCPFHQETLFILCCV